MFLRIYGILYVDGGKASKMEKERNCLKCGKSFASTGVGNRICPKCSKTKSNLLAPKSPKSVRDRLVKKVRKKMGEQHWSAHPIVMRRKKKATSPND